MDKQDVKVKMCGMMRAEDILAANELAPDFVGCILAKGFRRTVSEEDAARFRSSLLPSIPLVGVFVNDPPKRAAELLNDGVINIAQLHGDEDNDYIDRLRVLTDGVCPIIKAFKVCSENDILKASGSSADLVLLDSGTGSGKNFDVSLIGSFARPYLLAGGLTPDNVAEAVRTLRPYGVDVSSGIETDGHKDPDRMRKFMEAVRAAGQN